MQPVDRDRVGRNTLLLTALLVAMIGLGLALFFLLGDGPEPLTNAGGLADGRSPGPSPSLTAPRPDCSNVTAATTSVT